MSDQYEDTMRGDSPYEDEPNWSDDGSDDDECGYEDLQYDYESEEDSDSMNDSHDSYEFFRAISSNHDRDSRLISPLPDNDEEENDDSMNEHDSHRFYGNLNSFRDKDYKFHYLPSDDEAHDDSVDQKDFHQFRENFKFILDNSNNLFYHTLDRDDTEN